MSARMAGDRSRELDVIVVGGGHNGLVCAAYLARAGHKVLVLERRPEVGGVLTGEPLAPGLRSISAVHSVGRLSPRVERDLALARHGLRVQRADARLTSLDPSGRALTLWADARRTAAELKAFSAADSAAYPDFDAHTKAMAAFAARISDGPPPDVERLMLSDLRRAFGLWRGYRGLGRRRALDFLRVLPMPIADHVADYFETDQLRALLAWRGIRYTTMAATDAGSTQVFLADAAGTADGAAGDMTVPLGGPAVLATALREAATAAGAEVRTDAEVARITLLDGRARGVVLADGEEIAARGVVSGLDPKRTLLGLVDPIALGPTLAWEAENLVMRGGTSVVQLALAELPRFTGLDEAEARVRLSGRIVVAPNVRTLDRASDAVQAGRMADELVLEATIPTLHEPSLIEEGSEASQLVNVLVHGTPYHLADGEWDGRREALGDSVIERLAAVAPGIGDRVVARRVLTPLDLERDYGLTEGHPLHGEPSLDQWFAWRPMLGLARYRTPIDGLYLCGSGTHPGGGVTGIPGRLAAREVSADLGRGRTR